MLYASIAIIAAGIVAAVSPILREWYQQRRRREQKEEGGKGRH